MVLLIVLVFILISTFGATSIVEMHQTQTQREKEEQLLFVGAQYRRAINSYYNTRPPRGDRSAPLTLNDLLDDNRYPTAAHHLRRLYVDPMTGRADWVLVMGAGGIVGVHSASKLPTIKKQGFSGANKSLENKASYDEWVFTITPQ